MMKDEVGGKQITEKVGLRSKLYAIKIQDPTPDDKKKERKCKGVKKSVVKNNITFEHYKNCLFNNVNYNAKFDTLRSRKHEITTECITKVALSANDDKRIIIPNPE